MAANGHLGVGRQKGGGVGWVGGGLFLKALSGFKSTCFGFPSFMFVFAFFEWCFSCEAGVHGSSGSHNFCWSNRTDLLSSSVFITVVVKIDWLYVRCLSGLCSVNQWFLYILLFA